MTHSPIGYFRYFYGYLRSKLLFNIVLAVMLGLLDGIGLALFIPLLQFVNSSGSKQSASGESMGGLSFVIDSFSKLGIPVNLFTVLGLMVFVFILKGAMNYWLMQEQVDLRQRYMIALRIKQIDDLKSLSYRGFLELDAGKIQNVITAEVGKNIQALIQFLNSIKAVIMLISYLLLAFVANWQFAIFILIGAVLSNLLYKRIVDAVKTSSIDISRRGNLFSGYIIQAVHNFKYLKSTNYFALFEKKLLNVIYEVEKLNRRIGSNQAITASSREPVIIVIVATVILLQVNVMGSELGSIILSLLLFYRALNGLVLVQNSWQSFMQNVGSIDSISNLSSQMSLSRENQGERRLKVFNEKIEFSNVTFAYKDKPVITDLNLTINKNSTVAFVGESGSGKSTLANILTTLLKPQHGRLSIDGEDIENYNQDSYRAHIGYIAQEPVIFNDTLFNNVTFWAEKDEQSLSRFTQVIKETSLEDFLENLSEKEDTILGDNGLMISGGQKQRISIARELFKEIDILILDEATSALDSETELYIQNSIDSIKGEYTIIVIAHRLSTIKKADKICLLENGSITASGTFDELLMSSDRFSRMVRLQDV